MKWKVSQSVIVTSTYRHNFEWDRFICSFFLFLLYKNVNWISFDGRNLLSFLHNSTILDCFKNIRKKNHFFLKTASNTPNIYEVFMVIFFFTWIMFIRPKSKCELLLINCYFWILCKRQINKNCLRVFFYTCWW